MGRYGEPEDVEGHCNARLYLADNHGDNHATVRCILPAGHDGPHQKNFTRDLVKADDQKQHIIITWEHDESLMCEKHGRVEGPPPCWQCQTEEDDDADSLPMLES